jgi:hypothetical protein
MGPTWSATHNASSQDTVLAGQDSQSVCRCSRYNITHLAAVDQLPAFQESKLKPTNSEVSVHYMAPHMKPATPRPTSWDLHSHEVIPGHLNLHNLTQRQPTAITAKARDLFVQGLSNPCPSPSFISRLIKEFRLHFRIRLHSSLAWCSDVGGRSNWRHSRNQATSANRL